MPIFHAEAWQAMISHSQGQAACATGNQQKADRGMVI